MTDVLKNQKLRNSAGKGVKAQVPLCTALVLIALGNITPLGIIPIFSSVYLILSIGIIIIEILAKIDLWGRQLRYIYIISLVPIAFSVGFFATGVSDYGAMKFLGMGIMILLIITPFAFVDVSRNIEFMVKLMLWISGLASFMMIIFGTYELGGRGYLFGLNPIGIGRACGVGVVIAVAIFFWGENNSRRMKILASIFFFPCLIATLLTGSRGPILGVAIATVIILLIRWRIERSFRSILWLVLVPVTLILLYRSLSETSTSRLTSSNTSGRDVLFEQSWQYMRENPLGVGWGNFQDIFPAVVGDPSKYYSHNIFLEVAVEGGWFAAVALIVLVLAALQSSFSNAIKGNVPFQVVCALLVFAVVNASLSSDLVGNRLLWFLLGVSLLPAMFQKKPFRAGSSA